MGLMDSIKSWLAKPQPSQLKEMETLRAGKLSQGMRVAVWGQLGRLTSWDKDFASIDLESGGHVVCKLDEFRFANDDEN